jgi:hypothetical protein
VLVVLHLFVVLLVLVVSRHTSTMFRIFLGLRVVRLNVSMKASDGLRRAQRRHSLPSYASADSS